ncbi:hypothetical protein [Ferrovibrio xuzhouensis]|uniref:Uncharacterized protein n=1 Tax=Ferrovibrio xuzhouensis TaxID=1576914 RepID=A0ABV7VGG3_9PROT
MAFLETPRKFYEQFVLPNFTDYMSKTDDARLGLNAVIACWHLSDWVWRDRPAYWSPLTDGCKGSRPKERFLTYIKRQCPELDVLNSLANGTKHFLTRDDGYHSVELIKGIFYDPGMAHPVGIAPLGVIGKEPDWLLVEAPDPSGLGSIGLVEVLRRTVNWWPAFLDQHGL